MLNIDDDFVIQEAEKTSSTVFGQDIGATGTLKWNDITPEFAPDEEYHASNNSVEDTIDNKMDTKVSLNAFVDELIYGYSY